MPIKIGVNPEDVSLDFPVAPAGTYVCTISRAELGESTSEKNKGKPMLTVRFKPIEAINCFVGDKQVPISDRELFTFWAPLWQFPDKPDLNFRGLKQLAAAVNKPGCGWRNGELYPEEFQGMQVKVAVDVQERDNVKRNNVTGLFPV